MAGKKQKRAEPDEKPRRLTVAEEAALRDDIVAPLPGLRMTRALVGELVHDPDNANEHPDDNIAAVRESLKAFGQVQPLVVQRSTKRVIAGNARLDVMRELGWTHCNVLELDIDDATAIAFGLADNRSARLARWNAAKVLELVGHLEAFNPALTIAAGFTDDELAKLTNIAAKEEQLALEAAAGADRVREEDDDVEEPGDERVKLGEVWRLGDHLLICGDCADHTTALRSLGFPALGLHDPPYGIDIVGRGLADGKRHGNALAPRSKFPKIVGDDRAYDPAIVLGSAKVVIVWGANHFAAKLPASEAWIVWDKRVDLPSNGFSDAELAWVSTGGSTRIIRHKWNGFLRDSERNEKRLHPTQKPVAVLAELIAKYTRPGEVITDFYLGSGSTLIAAERTKRKLIGTEISPRYCDTIIARWEKATGKTAERAE